MSDIHLLKMWINYWKIDADTLLIDYTLKHDKHKTLEYAIENDIYALDDCIEFLVTRGGECNPIKCDELLHNMMVNGAQNSITYTKLQFAILHDCVDVLEILLTIMLQQEGIENIQSYRENEIVTFEFVFNVLKLCLDNAPQCAGLLKSWLQIIIKHQLQYESSRTNSNGQIAKDLRCILCLKQRPISNIGRKEHGYEYCACRDYQNKRV